MNENDFKVGTPKLPTDEDLKPVTDILRDHGTGKQSPVDKIQRYGLSKLNFDNDTIERTDSRQWCKSEDVTALETALSEARVEIEEERKYTRGLLDQRDKLQAENERLGEYETQCNSLSQRFGKSLIAEGIPAAIEYIGELQKRVECLEKDCDCLMNLRLETTRNKD